MRRVCIVIGSRANYSSIKSVMTAIEARPDLELILILFASSLLDKYGRVERLILDDGFAISHRIHNLIEGENPVAMAKSTGLGLIEIAPSLDQIKPDYVVVVGDRYETMAITLAACYLDIPLIHTMGGEVSGTIDESIRHATTKFASVHFPASEEAANRIIALGEDSQFVFNVGCPRIDLVKEVMTRLDQVDLRPLQNGVGVKINVEFPFLLVSQHPVTTEYDDAEHQMMTTLDSVHSIGIPSVVLWPNSDAGSDGISKAIRKFRESHPDCNMHFHKNLPVDVYIYLMSKTSCLVGNSSSGIREGAFIGTPVVNIGSRQLNRQRGINVIDVIHSKNMIIDAIDQQVSHGMYSPSFIYGNGEAGVQIAQIISRLTLSTAQKRIQY